MNQRKLDIQLRNTNQKYCFDYNPSQNVIEIIQQFIGRFKLSTNQLNVKLFFQGQCLDNSQTFEQQGIDQFNVVIEIEIMDKVIIQLHNDKLGNIQLKCDISTTVNGLNFILLKKLNFNSNYQVEYFIDEQKLNHDHYILELVTLQNLKYQVFSQQFFLYNLEKYELKIDVTIPISQLCNRIAEMIHVDSQQIQLDEMENNDLFHHYHIEPNTELIYHIIEIPNHNQVIISIVYDQENRQFTIRKDEKIQTLINKIKTSFFPNNLSDVEFKLIFNDEELQNESTIQQQNITNNSVIQLIVTKMNEQIFIQLKNKEQPDVIIKTKVFLDDLLSVIDRQLFSNISMEYFYQDQLLNKYLTFRQLEITQNDTIIEHKPKQSEQISIKFYSLDQMDTTEFQAQSDELLSKYIYQVIGRKTKEIWVSFNHQKIDNIDKTFEELQISNGSIFYQVLQVELKVYYNDDIYEILVNRDKTVNDLFIILRNHFQIQDTQEFELEYGNQNIKGELHCKKLWALCQQPYKIVFQQKGQLKKSKQSIKIYFKNQRQYVEFNINLDQTINQVLKEFLFFKQFPKNQPVECFMNNQNEPLDENVQIKDLDISEIQIEVKQDIVVGAQDKQNIDLLYIQMNFNSKVSGLLEKLKAKKCNFYFQNILISQEKTFQEIEFYNMNIIEYEIIEKIGSMVQVILIEKNQQQDYELDQESSIQELRQKLNLKSSEEEELFLNDNSVLKDEQILKQIAKDGKLTLNLRRIMKLISEQNKQQTDKKSQIINNQQELSKLQQEEQKSILAICIQDQKYQIEFDINKKVEDLRQLIIEKFNQRNDINIKYNNKILNPTDSIPVTPDFLVVTPLIINIKITIEKRKLTFEKKVQPQEILGNIIQKVFKQVKIQSNNVKLEMGNKVLDTNKTVQELGIVDGTELNLQI